MDQLLDQVTTHAAESRLSKQQTSKSLVKQKALTRRRIGKNYYRQIARVATSKIMADSLATLISVLLAFLVVSTTGIEINHFVPFAVCAILVNLTSVWSVGLYPGIGIHPANEMKLLVKSATVSHLCLFAVLFTTTSIYSPEIPILGSPYVRMLGIALPLFFVLGPLARTFAGKLLARSRLSIPFYFVGNRSDVFQIYQNMYLFGQDILEPVGRFVQELSVEDAISADERIAFDDDFERAFERQAVFQGTTDEILDSALRDDVYWLFVVRGGAETARQDILIPRNFFPQVIEMSSADLSGLTRGQMMNFGAATGIRVEECLLLPSSRVVKRAIDMAVSLGALIFLLPLLIFICIAIKLTSRGPILFSQERIGLHGVRFRAWKFRSMVMNASAVLGEYLEKHPEMRSEWAQEQKLRNDPRITRIGRLIRRTSLDELPQLWNVLVGDMSLVGPRPIVASEVAKYGSTFDDYIRVVPGITGLWQISGRSNTTYSQRLVLDRFYVRNWSVWFDIYILFRTFKTVATCEGAR